MDTTHERTVSIDDIDSLVPEPSSTNLSQFEEGFSINGEMMNQELLRAGEVLTKVELDLACSSEKLLNLSVLTMRLGTRESDFESFACDKEPLGADSAEKAMEFNLLSTILDSEVNEFENLIKYLQTEIESVRDIIFPFQQAGEPLREMKENFLAAEQSLIQLLDQILEMKMQSANFQRMLCGFDGIGNRSGGQAVEFQHDMSSEIKMQTADQQRNFLRMLEKSLAREIELEKKLTESRQIEKELQMKLYSSEQDVFYMEEEAQDAYTRWFEAENASEVFKGIAKELSGKLQILQFNLSGSFKRENDLKSELNDSKVQLATKERDFQKIESNEASVRDSENITLRKRLNALEEQLKDNELQAASAAEIRSLEQVIEDLKDKLTKSEARADTAESNCKLLDHNNKELRDELGPFKDKGLTPEKLEALVKKLKDSDIQLEHAIAAVEASQEKQNLLYSTISDMESVIKDLKSNVVRAENRADNAEEKLITVSEANSELHDDLRCLRGRLKEVEDILHQNEEIKMRTAKDIGIRNNIMRNMVMQLAVERERLHQKIYSLSVENSVLVAKLKQPGKHGYAVDEDEDEDAANSSKPNHSAESCLKEHNGTSVITDSEDERLKGRDSESEVEETGSKSDMRNVRRLDAGIAFGFKHLLIAIVFLILSSAAAYCFHRPS